MDIFAHGLWSAAAYRYAEVKKRRKFNLILVTFWGIFPDLFAFTVPFFWLLYLLCTGYITLNDLIPKAGGLEPMASATFPILQLSYQLYNISHSIVIFLLIFLLLASIFRHRRFPLWEMGAWLLHILIDIPTHSYRFFPTPFLWPLSDFKVDGLSWGTPWFMALNYLTLLIVIWILFIRKRKKKTVL